MISRYVDPEADALELEAEAAAFGVAIVAGCRYRLLTLRERSLRALRDGFTEHIDLSVQLGAFSSAELMRCCKAGA